jgi:hypothetical protein
MNINLVTLIVWLLGSAPAADAYAACPAKVLTFEAARLTFVQMKRGCDG